MYLSTTSDSVNSVINYVEARNFPISRHAIRKTFFAYSQFPDIRMDDICSQFQDWGYKVCQGDPFLDISSPVLMHCTIAESNKEAIVVCFSMVDGYIKVIHPEDGNVTLNRGDVTIIDIVDFYGPEVKSDQLDRLSEEEVILKKQYLDTIFTVKNFLSPDECQAVIYKAEGLESFSKSKVDEGKYSNFRSSFSVSFLDSFEDPLLKTIADRAGQFIDLSTNEMEMLQCVRYGVGQEFRMHYDSDPLGNFERTFTLLVYLNDDFEGGETVFNELNIKIAPVAGMALGFRNLTEAGEIDIYSAHSGYPVKSGVKYALNIWFRAASEKTA